MRLRRAPSRLIFGFSFCLVGILAGSQELMADAAQARRNFFRSFSATSLIGKPVTNSEWERVARVEQVMIDPENGNVTFVVLSFVDREGSFAIPWSALAVQERGQLHLPMDIAQLENTVRVHDESLFSRPGTAGAEGELVPEYDRFLGDHTGTWPAQPTEPAEPARPVKNEPGVLAGLVAGVVTAPLGERDPVMLLLLDTGLQQVTVDLGPKSRLEAAQFSVTPGQQVQVYGSWTAVQGRDLFHAEEIRLGARTLMLGTVIPDTRVP